MIEKSTGQLKRGRKWPESVEIPQIDMFEVYRGVDRPPIVEQVYTGLRRLILYNILPAGAWLRLDTITSKLGVSQTPVREAIRALHRDELVEVVSNHGARVAQLSIEEFEEIYALRKGIEGISAARAVPKLSFEVLNDLENDYRSLNDLLDQDYIDTYLQGEWKFRLKIYRCGDNRRFLQRVIELRERAERYLRFAYKLPDSAGRSFGYHHELLVACQHGDAALAEQIVQNMLDWTLRTALPVVAKIIEQRTDPGTSASTLSRPGFSGDLFG